MAWEPWTGCYKISDGCTYCYYYGPYSKLFGQNTVVKTDEFYKPIETIYMPRKKITKYKIESGKNIIPALRLTSFYRNQMNGEEKCGA